MDLAPNLYKVARRKKRSVHTEPCDFIWIRNLQQLDSMIQLEFTLPFMVTLTEQQRCDQMEPMACIRWLRHTSANSFGLLQGSQDKFFEKQILCLAGIMVLTADNMSKWY
jgi:hypothetical protein